MKAQRFARMAVAAGVVSTAVMVGLASTSSAGQKRSVPAAPTSVALVSGNRSLHGTWSESTGGALTFVGTAKSPGRVSKSCVSHTTSCTIAGLVNGVVYDVTVVAKILVAVSSPSSDVTATVGVQGPPRSVHANAEKARATISWSPPTARGVSKVTGYSATTSPGGFSCSTASTLITQAARSCEIAGLSPGATYSVTVTALNAYGSGTPSRAVAVTAS